MTGEPVLVFDGDCGFCTTSVGLAERLVGIRARVVPWQRADLAALGVTRERAEYELLWVEGGRVRGGAQAVAGLLIAAGLPWSPLGLLLRLPPVRWVAHGLYRLIAANRHRLPGGTPACALPAPGPGAAAPSPPPLSSPAPPAPPASSSSSPAPSSSPPSPLSSSPDVKPSESR